MVDDHCKFALITLTSILIGDIGEPPNIAKTNGEAER